MKAGRRQTLGGNDARGQFRLGRGGPDDGGVAGSSAQNQHTQEKCTGAIHAGEMMRDAGTAATFYSGSAVPSTTQSRAAGTCSRNARKAALRCSA